jgi:hypothetical protein
MGMTIEVSLVKYLFMDLDYFSVIVDLYACQFALVIIGLGEPRLLILI